MESGGHSVLLFSRLGELQPTNSKDILNIPNVHGLFVMQNKYINDGIANIYSCGQISVIPVFEHKAFSIDMSINNNILTITNRYGTVFTAQIEYQDLSYWSMDFIRLS